MRDKGKKSTNSYANNVSGQSIASFEFDSVADNVSGVPQARFHGSIELQYATDFGSGVF